MPTLAIVRLPIAAARRLRVGMTLAMLGAALAAEAARPALPVPAGQWIQSGAATRHTVGKTMTIQQRSTNATLQWDSFNIGAGSRVQFQQPNAAAVALNRIGQADPVRIAGALDANGQVYLINRNGIVFGRGAQVNVAGLIASTLDISPEAANRGILRAAAERQPAFSAFLDEQGKADSGSIHIERGASVRAAKGGNVLVFAPVVANDGSIETPDGQTILAAGEKTYLMASNDVNLRGLLVEVDVDSVSDAALDAFLQSRSSTLTAGTVSNDGSIAAARGNVTLAGLAVNQRGRISATTAVNANGTIRLQARDRVQFLNQSTTVDGTPVAIDPAVPARGGRLSFAPDSSTAITSALDDPTTQLAVNGQNPSTATLTGRQIEVQSGALVQAQGGRIEASARADFGSNRPDDSRIHIADGATLDVSGSSANLPASAHSLKVRLTATQLADAPVLRNGALRGQEITVDLFRAGTRSDGSHWVGTPIGDIASAEQTLPATVAQRTSAGGTVSLAANGATLLAPGATVNLSGGILHYAAGTLETSWLYTPQSTLVHIADADLGREYAGVFGEYAVTSRRWGITRQWHVGLTQASPEYHLTQDNGSLRITAPQVYLGANVLAETRLGASQRGIPGGGRAESLPAGAGLMLGDASGGGDPNSAPNYVSPDVALAVKPGSLSGLRNLDGTAFDPLTDTLPAALATTALGPDLFGRGHVQNLAIYSNGRISLPAGARLELPEAGQVTLAGGSIALAGVVYSPAGKFTALAQETRLTAVPDVALDLAAGARIDLRGTWVNDRQALSAGDPLALTLIDGGTVSLQSKGGALRLAANSVIDVGGGGWLSSGALLAGRGGSVSLAASPLPDIATPTEAQLGAELLGEAMGKPGALSVSVPALCLAVRDCAASDRDITWLTPGFLQSGFGQYALSANLGSLTVLPGTQLAPRVLSRVLDSDFGSVGNLNSIATLSSLKVLPALVRPPADLSLKLRAAPRTSGYDDASFADAGRLSISRGARITVDTGANLSLDSNTGLAVDGELSAPAGTLSLTLSNSLALSSGSPAADLLARQTLWLGPHSRLLATGALRPEVSLDGVVASSALAGGTVRLTAERGYVLQQPGSVIDVAGVAGGPALPALPGGLGTPVGASDSSAGSLRIAAGEGLVLGGSLRGAAGSPDFTAGLLSLALDPSLRNEPSDVFVGSFSHLPATLRLSGAARLPGSLFSAVDAAAPLAARGTATLRVPQVIAGGFDRLALFARNQTALDSAGQLIPGQIVLADSPSLALARSLTLSAASLVSDGTHASLQAPYVALGNEANTTALAQATPTPFTGLGTLRVAADLIDLIGHSSTSGFAQLTLGSNGDLRLRGVQDLGSSDLALRRSLQGGLLSSASIALTAAQIYPTTLSEFSLSLVGNPQGAIELQAATAEAPALPLSAAGRFSITAPIIRQAGVLRAPFGQISLVASDELELLPGSLTSISARGALIPFGASQGGIDWTYPLAGGETLVFDGKLDRLPSPTITLDAGQRMKLAKGAEIDLSGGGDLLAYEFSPGPSGTRDVLSAAIAPEAFAVLPSLGAYAPYDALYASGSLLNPDDSVYLAASPGLPAGRYARLPARYALLPGAFLVTPLSGYRKLPVVPAALRPDGSAVVTGYREVAQSGLRASATDGYSVLPSTAVQNYAEYTLRHANDFFTRRAVAQDLAIPAIPADAGLLQILARGSSLSFAPHILAASSKTGRGAAVDIASSLPIAILGNGDQAAVGELGLSASALESLEVSSVLLGGVRRADAVGVAIDTLSTAITVGSGASLRGPEWLLTATDSITLDSGASLQAAGPASLIRPTYQLQGDGVFLRAASGPAATILREGESPSPLRGTFTLTPGARLGATGGALQIDASAGLELAGALDLRDATLGLGAPRISLGEVGEGATGLVLDDALLARAGIADLLLSSRQGIDLYGGFSHRFNRLVLNAPGLGAYDNASATAVLRADEIMLANPGGDSYQPVADRLLGTGTLLLAANTLQLSDGTGAFAIRGFETVTGQLDRAVLADGHGSLQVTGQLDLAAPLLTASAGADWQVSSTAAMNLTRRAPVGTRPSAEGLGARLTFTAPQILDDATIALPSGQLRLSATGSAVTDSVTLGSNAVLDLAGQRRSFAGRVGLSPAGSLWLASTAGDVRINAGALIDLSAPAGGSAGRLSLAAPAGHVLADGLLRGSAGTADDRSAAVDLDVGTLEDFSGINGFLETGGAHRERRLRVRTGNVAVDANDTVTAHRFSLIAEAGDISISGQLDASGDKGGALGLSASGSITLNSGAELNVKATAPGAEGGYVQLVSAAAATGGTAVGGIQIAAGAVVDVGGGAGGKGGQIGLRLPQATARTATAALAAQRRLVLDGTLRGADDIVLEGVRAYSFTTIGSAQVDAALGNRLFDDARSFMDRAAAIETALGYAADPAFHVRPGLELRSLRDLTLSAGWNLHDWRFDDEPGVLSLRAGGNLWINANLSDGFTSALTNTSSNLQATGESWSYRLVAGADLQSADPLALRSLSSLAAGSGNLVLAGGTPGSGTALPALRVIRTGTGSIDLAAARDLSFGNAASVVYTAGHASPTGLALNAAAQLGGRPYPVDGGDISLVAGGEIIGAPTDQLVSAWLFRCGRPEDANGPSSATGWTVAFERFQQGVGTLGGGDLRIEAGGNISNLSAVVPTIGVQTGGSSFEDSRLVTLGGGDMQVRAGGDIRSGVYYLGRGQGALEAAGSVTFGRTVGADDPTALYTVLALGEGNWSVLAAADLTLETVVTPTLITQSLAQRGPGLPKLSYFSTYAANSAVTLGSLFGAVTLNNDASALASAASSVPITTVGDLRALAVLPPSLTLRAFGGDVNFANGFALAPSATGTLSVLAAKAVNFANGADLVMADSDPVLLGTPQAPVPRFANPAGGHAAQAVHAAALGGVNEVVAASGSILMGSDARLVMPASIDLVAGLDLLDPNVLVQHADPREISVFSVGRDLRYTLRRDASGNLQQTLAGIALAGPGRLQVNTGRDLDLGTSRGIETLGNQTNPALPAEGASIDLAVGLLNPAPDFSGFIERYLADPKSLSQLIDYVTFLRGAAPASGAEALAYFEALSPESQQALVQSTLFKTLSKAGRAAATARNAAPYKQGYAALEALYPAAHYGGELSLFFSKIYTLAGGDINLLVPGGSINTGLAAVSAGFGVNKLPSELGIVAQSTGNVSAFARDDILVNQSRIFAADGGKLLLWSSLGDIDAGRGAKTAISAPPPTISTDANGDVIVRFPPALTGSGIQNFVTTPGRVAGDVELYAPEGLINASDAGVGSAGKVFTSLNVINTTNIAAAGGVVGVPMVDVGALGGALAGVAGAASAATQASGDLVGAGQHREAGEEMTQDAFSLNVISVEVLGFGS